MANTAVLRPKNKATTIGTLPNAAYIQLNAMIAMTPGRTNRPPATTAPGQRCISQPI